MKGRGLFLLLIVVVGAGAAYWYLGRSDGMGSAGTTEYTSKHGSAVTVTSPKGGDVVTSPLTVVGVVPGTWSFEANVPLEILDANHKPVASGHGTVKGDWMTEKPVNFEGTVTFKAPVTDRGFLVVRKDNPSDDEATNDSVEVPIRFGS
jgi:hypothetical protein